MATIIFLAVAVASVGCFYVLSSRKPQPRQPVLSPDTFTELILHEKTVVSHNVNMFSAWAPMSHAVRQSS